MKIYHYTSIDTLALILSNRTMRFNRLDRVDDIEEALYSSGAFKTLLGNYQFASCWTKKEAENITLWDMYTQYKGVRIGLEENPFVTYQINADFSSFIQWPLDVYENCMLFSSNNPSTLFDVQYVKNLEEKVNSLVDNSQGSISFNSNELGLYKREEWAPQEESRYKLLALPVDMIGAFNNLLSSGRITLFNAFNNLINSIYQSMMSNFPIGITYIDLPLNLEKLNHIEVMLGPLVTDSDKKRVVEMLKPFPDATIIPSKLKIRKKS